MTDSYRRFIRHCDRLPDLVSVWTFVMDHADEFPSLNVEITAVKHADEADDEVMYDVAVFGDAEGGW